MNYASFVIVSTEEKVTWSGAAASHYFGRGVSIWDSPAVALQCSR